MEVVPQAHLHLRLATASLLHSRTQLHIRVLALHLLVDLLHEHRPLLRLGVHLTSLLAALTLLTSLGHLLYPYLRN
jgi:hypothetical protein